MNEQDPKQGKAIQAAAPKIQQGAVYTPSPTINVNGIKPPQMIQNMNMGKMPAYARTSGLPKVK